MKLLGAIALGIVGLAVTIISGIAILNGYQDTGLVENTTVDKFISGLLVFGTFISVLVVTYIGKILIKAFKD